MIQKSKVLDIVRLKKCCMLFFIRIKCFITSMLTNNVESDLTFVLMNNRPILIMTSSIQLGIFLWIVFGITFKAT